MITVTRTYTRPNAETPFHLDKPFCDDIYTQDFKEHVQTTYGNAIIHLGNTLSEDFLTLSFQSIWDNRQNYEAYINDPVCTPVWAARDAHNAAFGIISTPSVITEV